MKKLLFALALLASMMVSLSACDKLNKENTEDGSGIINNGQLDDFHP